MRPGSPIPSVIILLAVFSAPVCGQPGESGAGGGASLGNTSGSGSRPGSLGATFAPGFAWIAFPAHASNRVGGGLRYQWQ
jgi:hypothetical protein